MSERLLEMYEEMAEKDKEIERLTELTTNDRIEIGSYREGTGLRGENQKLQADNERLTADRDHFQKAYLAAMDVRDELEAKLAANERAIESYQDDEAGIHATNERLTALTDRQIKRTGQLTGEVDKYLKRIAELEAGLLTAISAKEAAEKQASKEHLRVYAEGLERAANLRDREAHCNDANRLAIDKGKLQARVEELELSEAYALSKLDESLKIEGELRADNERLRAAGAFLCAVLRTRTWEDADMNACGMKAGDSTDVHALRKMETALQQSDDKPEGE